MPPDATTVVRLARTRTVDLVTIGRKSSQPQRVEIWWFHFEDRFIITGTPGRRDWYANILANPRVVIETRHGDFPATATTVFDQPSGVAFSPPVPPAGTRPRPSSMPWSRPPRWSSWIWIELVDVDLKCGLPTAA